VRGGPGETSVRVYNNSYLKSLYNKYNRQYFDNKLPDILVGYATTRQFKTHRVKKGTCAFTSFDDTKHTKPTAIVVLYFPGKSMLYIKADLLHEMVHVSKPRAEHGKVFKKERRRILLLGAFDSIL
jgi:hypothetical protein